MNKSFFQRFREIRIEDILHVFLFILAIIPALVYRLFFPPFWLICEYGNEARDNGYYFYRYAVREHPEQSVVYAIRPDSADYARVHDLGKTVPYGSFRHWVLYLAAQANISSQKGGKPNAAICYLLEVYWRLVNNRVFLQHGITKDDLPYVYYKNARFSLFSVSTEQEYRFISDNFGYPPGAVQKLGMCRFDDLQDTSDGRLIVVMPTWRQWLAKDKKPFAESEYYAAWTSLLQSKDLQDILEKNDLHLCFYPHREMQRFKDTFSIETERIHLGAWPEDDVHELLKKGALLITDYSSVAMDFAYMDKPVIYYQFDVDAFRQSHLKEGYFSYVDDGFGPVLPMEVEVLDALRKNVEKHFELSEEYQRRIEAFFDLRDCNNCARTYDAVRDLVRKNK